MPPVPRAPMALEIARCALTNRVNYDAVWGHVIVKKRLARQKVLLFLAQLPPCLMGMEASGGAHDWAREFTKLGHTVQRCTTFVIDVGVSRELGKLGRHY